MPQSSDESVLELEEVRKTYGSVPALDGLVLRVRRGQVYGFLGRNGAGKSTTLRIVMGITRPDRGLVRLFGSPTRPSDVRVRERIGYVAQEQHFYEWMKPDALGAFVGAFYPTWDAQRFALLLKRFEVPDRKVRTFSGGMKVKLALALALAHRPELLVLDEPTAGLDAVVRREFIEIVRDLATRGEHTTVFSSHLIDEVELVASRVGIIEAGRMRYEGSLPDLAARVRVVAVPNEDVAAVQHLERVDVPGLRVLGSHEWAAERQVTIWADDLSAFAILRERVPDARFRQPSLEDTFIALVRPPPTAPTGVSE